MRPSIRVTVVRYMLLLCISPLAAHSLSCTSLLFFADTTDSEGLRGFTKMSQSWIVRKGKKRRVRDKIEGGLDLEYKRNDRQLAAYG